MHKIIVIFFSVETLCRRDYRTFAAAIDVVVISRFFLFGLSFDSQQFANYSSCVTANRWKARKQ